MRPFKLISESEEFSLNDPDTGLVDGDTSGNQGAAVASLLPVAEALSTVAVVKILKPSIGEQTGPAH